ncbi:Holliday junction resolvase RuvX [Aurantimonas sp. Leaf443]|uniref:Holliday junction resolvase RuvX n=1 Tax=Aurantimonas sp. Leaf443 TaxID=1736378 RepID=UPI0006FE94B1|nr:Holliday junction resolvase RuvX [Aurantimonas sp. Leaf443]KQT83411.1 Holliday junction resolvase [Aurantimonas sp. Leaf443]
MPLLEIDAFAKAVPPGRTIAGLDLGTKTIGIAVCDLGHRFATPRAVVARTKFTLDVVAMEAILERDKVAGLVLGLPRNMDGTEGVRAQSTRAFARNLLRLRDWPILLWDERLSTVAAERGLLEADVSRRKRAERIDSAAAAFILQGAIDRLSLFGDDEAEPDERPG